MCGLPSLTKHVNASSTAGRYECDKYAVNDRLSQHTKGGCTPQERYQEQATFS